jgi:hypothetical protein
VNKTCENCANLIKRRTPFQHPPQNCFGFSDFDSLIGVDYLIDLRCRKLNIPVDEKFYCAYFEKKEG